MADPFTFELVSAERLLLSEPATEVVVPGVLGDFTMLAGHAPFMTTLRPGVIAVTDVAGHRVRYYVRGGLADAGPGGLTILADRAFPATEVAGAVAAAELAHAEADVARGGGDEARANAAQRLADVRTAIDQATAAPATTH